MNDDIDSDNGLVERSFFLARFSSPVRFSLRGKIHLGHIVNYRVLQLPLATRKPFFHRVRLAFRPDHDAGAIPPIQKASQNPLANITGCTCDKDFRARTLGVRRESRHFPGSPSSRRVRWSFQAEREWSETSYPAHTGPPDSRAMCQALQPPCRTCDGNHVRTQLYPVMRGWRKARGVRQRVVLDVAQPWTSEGRLREPYASPNLVVKSLHLRSRFS